MKGDEDGRANQRAEPIPNWLVRILLAGRHAKCLSEYGQMDSKKAKNVSLEAMEETENQSQTAYIIRHA